MTDPYKVLGVNPSASDEEIKNAYRALAKKYHPDQYSGSPIAELADEKMKEINEAYDEVVNRRKNGSTNNSNPYTYQQNTYQQNRAWGGNSSSGFGDVRNLINLGRIADAEQILNGVPADRRNDEWYFLKGSVLYRRGWLEEARENFSRACQMNPSNAEYRAALNQSMGQRTGAYGGYNNRSYNAGGCNSCDMCSSLLCADCCCECMGGDLIGCC